MADESLSIQLEVEGDPFSPQEAIRWILQEIISRLDDSTLGHIKATGKFSDGLIYASTALIPPEINFRDFGKTPTNVAYLEVSLTCVLYQQSVRAILHEIKTIIRDPACEYQITIKEGPYERIHHHHG
jgi:hypothetical protein